jgi:predicted acetyltransferase
MASRTPPHLAEPHLSYAREDGAEAYFTAISRGFHTDYDRETWEPETQLTEWDRSFGFQVDDRWIATCGAYSRSMTVPGGRLPVAAVSIVTVSPAYRRRGLLTQMMKHQLEDVARRGVEPVALLWASESAIYGRYGYGLSAPRVQVSGPTRSTAFVPNAPQAGGSVDEVSREEYRAWAAELYAGLLPDRPGALERTAPWWDEVLADSASRRPGATALRYAVHFDEAGRPDGYAAFRLADGDPKVGPRKEVRIVDLDATDAGSYAALWRYLLDLDLVGSFSRRIAPVDEPLLELVADRRAIRTEVLDGTYARLVDLVAALEARAYSTAVDVVMQVQDPLLPANDGVWRLEAGPEGVHVTSSTREPDVSLATRELGAAYLGGPSLNTLHRAGLVEEHRSGSVAALARALAWPTRPFCPDTF